MNIPTHIDLRIGERYELTLHGLGSAGHSWTYTIEGNDRIVGITKEMAGHPPAAQAGGVPPGNYSLDERFIIQALEAGNVTLHFTQSRSWEKSKAPLREFNLEIQVSG